MGLYDNFPYTNKHELNTDWIVKKIGDIDRAEEATADSAAAAKASQDAAAASQEAAALSAANAAESETAARGEAERIEDSTELLNNMNTRISEIIAHNNDTQGNSELIDIRTAGNGYVYPSAGDAVRAEFNLLVKAIKETYVENVLIRLKPTQQHSSFVYNSDGSITISKDTTTTEYMTLGQTYNDCAGWFEPGQKYDLIFNNNGTAVRFWVYWYDENNTALSNQYFTANASFTVPSNAAKFICRIWANTTAHTTVYPIVYAHNNDNMPSRALSKASLKEVKYVDFPQYPSTQLTDSDLPDNSFLFVTSSGGTPAYDSFPWNGPGWLFNFKFNNNISLQFAVKYDTSDYIKYRVKAGGTWGGWINFSGGNNVTENTYNIENTYTISTTPTITADSNYLLNAVDTESEDETGKTDMTGPIMSMLTNTGVCKLGKGIFYISGNINMPEESYIEGQGNETIVRMLSSVTSGYCFRMTRNNTIRNLKISGAYADIDIQGGVIGNRIGIALFGNRDGQHPEYVPASISNCMIEGLSIERLDSGIYGFNSGGGLNESARISNCYIYNCMAGINFDYWTEYHKVMDVIMHKCYYAAINNGGNNVFVGCTFHGVIGIQMDNSTNDKPNSGHGTISGCTFNHINNQFNPGELGNGYGVIIRNIDNGFLFDSCQFWYSKESVENSEGIQFTGCMFGGGTPTIEKDSATKMIFANNIFSSAPSFTNKPILVNNYTYDGNIIN